MKKTTLLIFLLVGYAETSSAQLFGPRNYEDCIIEGMQGVTSDVAARAVQAACFNKFRERPSRPQSRIDFEGTCDFLFDPDTRTFTRLKKGEAEALTGVKRHVMHKRDGIPRQELEAAADALIEANDNNSPNLEFLKEFWVSLSKRVYAPYQLTEDYVASLYVPYCSR